MTGIDTWTALASGAYVLAENYLYTTECIELMYRRLNPGGIIQITRFAQDMETLRLLSNVQAAFEVMGVPDMSRSVMAISNTDTLTSLLIKKGEFTQEEQRSTVEFAFGQGFELTYVPRLAGKSRVHDFLMARDRASFIDEFPRDISPTSDDRPYFFSFTKWSDPFGARLSSRSPTTRSP